MERVVNGALEYLVGRFGEDRRVLVFSLDEDDLVVRAVHGLESHQIKPLRLVFERVKASGQPALITNTEQDADYLQLALMVRSALCVPALHEDRLMGVLYIDSPDQTEAFTHSDLAAVQQFATGMARDLRYPPDPPPPAEKSGPLPFLRKLFGRGSS